MYCERNATKVYVGSTERYNIESAMSNSMWWKLVVVTFGAVTFSPMGPLSIFFLDVPCYVMVINK